MFVKDVTDTYQKDMTKVKWLFDLSALLIAVVLMLVLFRRFAFNMVGLNTVLATIVNAPLIGFLEKCWIVPEVLILHSRSFTRNFRRL